MTSRNVEAFSKSDLNLVYGFDLFVNEVRAFVRRSSADRGNSQRRIVGAHPQHSLRAVFALGVNALETQQPIRVQFCCKIIDSLQKNRPPFSRSATAGT
jgi:hypothetical protein